MNLFIQSLLDASVPIYPIYRFIASITNIKIVEIVLSAFFGGLFAAYWTYTFEIKRNLLDKRREKYNDHRNTIVQLEHELMPLRINLSRDQASINDALDTQTDTKTRLILRFYKLKLSTGLSLKLVNLDFINKYSELYSLIESINADFDYLNDLSQRIQAEIGTNRFKPSYLVVYRTMLPVLKVHCDEVDKKSLDLLIYAQLALRQNNKKTLEKYLDSGDLIEYHIDPNEKTKQTRKITREETRAPKEGEVRPQFASLYLDIEPQLQPR